MNTSTLVTKVLLPHRRKDVLTRQRLLDQLYDMVDRKVILVSAPAGYGKTTLLIDFAHDLEHPVCWYTLDESDCDPRIFLEHLILSLNRHFPDFGERARQALAVATDLGSGAPGVIDALLNEIVDVIPRWFVLVLDDYHRLGEAPEIEAILNRCLAYQGGRFLLVIASRGAVELPSTITLMARGEIGGIGQEALRFTTGEIRKLIAQNYGLDVPEEKAEAMAVQSEGWITGILLTAHTMWKGILDSLVRARSSDLPVYEYLAQEVLIQQELPVQEFLTASSTLREMNPILCREALGLEGAEHFLTLLEDRNLFVIRLDDEWCRYHHLFQEYLQARLQQDEKSRWIELHRRAAAWFDAHGQPDEAVHHYLAVDAYEDAACVMEAAVRDAFYAGRLETLMAWGAALPASLRERAPRLTLFQSRAADMLGRWKESLALTEIAERGYRAREDHHGLAYALLQRCKVWQDQGQFRKALTLGQETLSLIEETDAPVHYEAHRILGRAYLSLGRLDEGEAHLQQSLTLCLEQGDDYARSSIQGGLADCLWRQGRWPEAVAIQRQAVETRRRMNNPSTLSGALNDLGFFLYSTGEHSEALALFEDALALARRSGNRQIEAMTLLSLGELTRDLGAFEQAIKTCEEGLSIADELGHGFLSAYGREALGLAYRCRGDHALARAAIEQAVERAKGHNSEYESGRYRASLGLVLVEMGEVAAGLKELAQARAKLQQIGARSELTRAQFFTAWALFQVSREPEALTILRRALDAVDSPGQEPLFIVEGQRALPLLECAHARGIGNGELLALIDRVRVFTHTAQAILSRAAFLDPETGTEARASLRIFGFGHGKVERAGKTVSPSDWGAVATRYMLFYALTHRSRSRDQIAAVLWPELSSSKVKANFHSTKSRLNRALGRDVLYFDDFCYDVHPDLGYWFDVEEFEQLLRETRSDRRTESLQQAIALYRGDFLQDCYADWAMQHREMLRRQCLEAVAELAERLLARRRYRQVIPVLQQGLRIDELREDLHCQLMRAYALSGQRTQALVQYQNCVETLERELGTIPSRATNELYRRILDELPLD